MLRLLVAVLLVLLVGAAPAHAATITVEWNPAAGATSYDIEQSLNDGVTWTSAKVGIVASIACLGTPLLCTTTLIPPATGLVLFRIVAISNVGRTIRVEAGFWYNELWVLPGTAKGAGIQ